MTDTSITTLDYITGDAANTDFKKFPTTVFPEAISRFVQQAADSIVCPPELVGVPLLVMMASAIGASRVIELKSSWLEGPTLYAACIARPGDKKTPAANAATRPAREVQSQLRYRYQRERKLYDGDAGVAGDADSKEPVMERTLVEDTTVEALAKVLNENPRGVLIHRDELSAWIRSMDQYKQAKGSDRQFWLSVWSSSFVAVDRKGQQDPIMLDRPSVSVYGSIQPSVLPELGAGREDGLLDRFLFAYPGPMPSRWSDTEIGQFFSNAVLELYSKLRKLVLDTNEYGVPVPVRVRFDEDARLVFIQLVDEHRAEMDMPGFPERLRGPWAKLEAYFARLTLVLSLMRSVSAGLPERIEMQDVLSAQVLLNYFKDQARKVYGVLYEADPKDQFAADVFRFVQALGGHVKATPSNIFYALRSNHKPERPDEMTKWLLELAKRSPGLEVNQGSEGRGDEKRRTLELTLEIGVPGVPAVPTDPDAPLAREEFMSGWSPVARELSVTGRYLDGYLTRDEAIELGARAVLYGLGRNPEAWQRYAEYAAEILDRATEGRAVDDERFGPVTVGYARTPEAIRRAAYGEMDDVPFE